MKKHLTIVLFLSSIVTQGQDFKLKSVTHGLDLIYREDVPKDSIINNTRFADGKDATVDILRLDNIGNTTGADLGLIISSKQPVPSDSLGMNFLKIDSDSSTSLIILIQ